jgi:hypothetical protein
MTPVFKKALGRRTLLRGIGASVALPVLDAMSPAFGAAAKKTSPRRLSFVHVPNGIVMDDWTPKAFGPEYELTPILKPLEPFRRELLVMTGLAHRNGEALGDGPGDHARAGAVFLTGAHPKKTAGADIYNGVSIDQIVAEQIGGSSWLPSLQLGCEDARTVGDCDSGYSCAYTNSISWRSPTTPLPPENNPRMAFERLFGALDPGSDPKTRELRARQRRSVLDAVGARTRELQQQLGPSDRRKLDEYLHGIRELEQRIEKANRETRDLSALHEKPAGAPALFADYVKLMFDLQLVAFQADLTRVVTMMIAKEGSLRSYPELGVPDPHHPLTHHRNQKDWIEQVSKINAFHTELFGYFLGRLRDTQDGDGTLLDHSMVVYGSAIADGNRHTHHDLPLLVAGKGGGSLRPGRHVSYASRTPMTNLFLALADRMDVRPVSLGDSTGLLEQLT